MQDWYSGTPPYETTILSGIRNAVKEGTEVIHAEDNRMDQAEKAAAAADIAIVCVGNHPYGTRADWKFSPVPSDGREAVDRKSLMLPDEDLVKLVLKANPNTILVLVSSFPYTINWSQEHVPAIVHITHCSQEQGNGLADVLFGKVNPAGHTVQTWVKDITDLPDMMDYDIRNGRTYMYHQGPVLYPFGYGLSCTTSSPSRPLVFFTDTVTRMFFLSCLTDSIFSYVKSYSSMPAIRTPKWNVLPSSCAPSSVSPSRPAKPGK